MKPAPSTRSAGPGPADRAATHGGGRRHVPHVAVLIETSRGYGRGLLQGVARYNRQHGPWSMYFEPHGLDDPPPGWLRTWKGDGILARINDEPMAQVIRATGLPVVDVRG